MWLPSTVADVTKPVVSIPASATCADVDALFRERPGLSSVAVMDGDQLGLVMRAAFSLVMSGPFGYGRTLWARRPVADVTDWAPITARVNDSIVATAQRLRVRPTDRRHDDVLVECPGEDIGRASAADLFDALAQQYTHRAVHDDLTGLVNRAHFLELLTAACADRNDSVVVVLVDLDAMKRINDSYGHLVGDAVLVHTARHLSAAVRPGDLVARLGADEFVIMTRMPYGQASAAATAFGERCRLAVGAPDGTPVPHGLVHASVGVAIGGPDAEATTLLAEADMAMFRAKQAGGDQVQMTADVGRSLAGNTDSVDRSLLDAIRDGELHVWYQPVIRIRDRTVASVEALIRWQHPTMGLLAPGRFLPGARRAGHLPSLDAWVLTRACEDFAGLAERLGPAAPERLAVNLAPATLATDFDHLVESTLSRTGLSASRLSLELPEDADLASLATVAPKLERLRDLGVALVLDDMGAGSTSLRHLSTLTIGGLKIDRAFIAGMLHNPRDHTVVKLLADLGRGLSLPVVAEGVEHPDQLAVLADLDIEFAQGYELGRPQPLETLASLLHQLSVR